MERESVRKVGGKEWGGSGRERGAVGGKPPHPESWLRQDPWYIAALGYNGSEP